MKYRKFNAAGLDVSLLGFGAMRLPILDNDMSKIDEDEAIRMIRYAIDNGVNYVDTAYMYHGEHGEELVGKALADGYREKVFLATKMPPWSVNKPEDLETLFNDQLKKLQTDYIDFYLVHCVSESFWDKIQSLKMWDFIVKKREAGKVGYIGFSFHGSCPEFFKKALDEYPWDFCQLQVNYMDMDIQAGMEGFKYANSKNVPVVVMEPLKGGKLVDAVHPDIQGYWDSIGTDRTPAEWALRWVANLPGVLTILSGMTTMEHVEENLRVLSDAGEGMLSDAELAVIDKVAEKYRSLTAYQCTACNYCMPCTAGINIPQMMGFRNFYELYRNTEKMKGWEYKINVGVEASACTECGKCEPLCPQHLEIMRAMKETKEIFEG